MVQNDWGCDQIKKCLDPETSQPLLFHVQRTGIKFGWSPAHCMSTDQMCDVVEGSYWFAGKSAHTLCLNTRWQPSTTSLTPHMLWLDSELHWFYPWANTYKGKHILNQFDPKEKNY